MTADLINHPPHYTGHPSGVECITITRHMGFNLGNAVKYLWRADLKGAALDDLRKAAWYIADEIAKRERASTLPREGLPFAVVKAERDAARAIDTEPQPLEWPQTPEISPHSATTPTGYAGVAARDQTAYSAQDSGVEE